MRPRLAIGLLGLAVLYSPPIPADEAGKVDSRASERRDLETYWRRFGLRGGNDPKARDLLLAGGETSLEVLLDLLYDPAARPIDPIAVAKLLEDLGDDEFQVREAASNELYELGFPVKPALEQAAEVADPEVRFRARAILDLFERRFAKGATRESLLRPATLILEEDWPIEEVRAVALRNVDRLMKIEKIEYSSEARPLAPFLASLRCSPVAEDRSLLAKVAISGADGAAQVALSLMKDGLRSRDSRYVAEHWRNPPEHDYSDVVLACLDPARPNVFREAMQAAAPGADLVARLHEHLESIEDKPLRRDVYSFLWQRGRDPLARDYYIAQLAAERESDFRAAVYHLTDEQLSVDADSIMPHLVQAVRNSDWPRQALVLARMERFANASTAASAASAIAPLLLSDIEQVRIAAASTLLKIHSKVDVLTTLAGEGHDEEVRKAVTVVLEQWKAQQQAGASATAKRD